MKNANAPAVNREVEEVSAKTDGDEEAPYQRDPARADLQKNCSIESGVRQRAFGSCDLIKERETGDAKCLTRSTLAPRSGALPLLEGAP